MYIVIYYTRFTRFNTNQNASLETLGKYFIEISNNMILALYTTFTCNFNPNPILKFYAQTNLILKVTFSILT